MFFLLEFFPFFSPCILPLLPVYAGVLLDDKDGAQASSGKFSISLVSLLRTLAFIAGISFVFYLTRLWSWFFRQFAVCFLVSVCDGCGYHSFGLAPDGSLTFERTLQGKKATITGTGQKGKGYSQAFLLGLTFSFAWTPCVGPVLGSVLALAASGGSGAWQGAGLMLIYTLGLALPFLVLALASSYVLKHFRKLHPYLGTLKKVGGFLIIVMGILVLLGNASILTRLFE